MNVTRTISLSMMFLIVAGIGTYTLKHKVIHMESQLSRLKRETVKLKESMHVLNAEWAYLNRPERLQQLAQDKLGMSHTSHEQFISLDQLSEAPVIAHPLVHLTAGAS